MVLLAVYLNTYYNMYCCIIEHVSSVSNFLFNGQAIGLTLVLVNTSNILQVGVNQHLYGISAVDPDRDFRGPNFPAAH